MQKWEYTWIVFENNWGQIKIDGKKKTVSDHLKDLGQEGWETITIYPTAPGNAYSMPLIFFKRPIEE